MGQTIVKRLRNGAHNEEGTILGGVRHDKRCLEAADTIEELLEALKVCSDAIDHVAGTERELALCVAEDMANAAIKRATDPKE